MNVAILSTMVSKGFTFKLGQYAKDIPDLNLTSVYLTHLDVVARKEVEALKFHDVVYYRGEIGNEMRTPLLRALRNEGVAIVNSGLCDHGLLHDKGYQAMTLSSEKDLAALLPKSIVYSWNPRRSDKCVAEEVSVLKGSFSGGLVIKEASGQQGEGVYLAQSIEKILELPKGQYVLQEKIANDGDYRVFVAGEDTFAYKRTPKVGEFRANIHQGGSVQSVDDEVSNRLGAHAKKIASHFDLDLVGVDFIIDQNTGKEYFIEINTTPGSQFEEWLPELSPWESVVSLFRKKFNEKR